MFPSRLVENIDRVRMFVGCEKDIFTKDVTFIPPETMLDAGVKKCREKGRSTKIYRNEFKYFYIQNALNGETCTAQFIWAG